MALGFCGLSLQDFRALTPSEFKEVMEARESTERNAWERTRISAAITLQPWSKKALKPQSLLPLPWDKNRVSGKDSDFDRDKAVMLEMIEMVNRQTINNNG